MYGPDLAWIHHAGYSQHVANAWPGIVRFLREGGLAPGARVLDVGCGSGLLCRRLVEAGFVATGIDASPAMIEIARSYAPAAAFEVMRLPIGALASGRGGLPETDAVVSTGHVLNYLDSRHAIARTLAELACSLRPGGVLAIDLMTEEYRHGHNGASAHAKVSDDWVIVSRFSRPAAYRLDRAITVFRRVGDGWRRSDEHHRNVTFDVQEALRVLSKNGVDAKQRPAFGDERLPQGLVVVTGTRRP